MNANRSFQRLTGILSISAGILALISLAVGLAGVNYDFEVFSDTSSLIASGSTAASYIRWSYWLNMLGNYLLLIPLALFLYTWLEPLNRPYAQLYSISGLLYLILGAAGSAVLAAAWPYLIEQYETASAVQQEFLTMEFQVVNAIAEEGLHGVIQNLAGAIWFIGIGALMRSKRSVLGIFTIVIGLFLALNTIGNMFGIEMFSLVGLTANILLGPLWSIWLGILLVRLKTD